MHLTYFNNIFEDVEWFTMAQKHSRIIGFCYVLQFLVGDVVEVAYYRQNIMFKFEGVCISVRRKGFVLPDLVFTLRNVVWGVSIEMTFSYFYHRLFDLVRNDYKRKSNLIRRSKLYYVRNRLNRESRVRAS
jgi:ribosomal protein L19